MTSRAATILKNGHVIDPAQNIDGPADVLMIDGKLAGVGRDLAAPPEAKVIDVAGHYVTAGWIDLHVHAYGTLGFSDLDSIGIYQGVTSYVDAGGPGLWTLAEFAAMAADGVTTALYAGPHIFPTGIVGLDYVESQQDVGDLAETVDVAAWREALAAYPGTVRFIKAAAYSPSGPRPMQIAKAVTQELGLPLYLHIGEIHLSPELNDPFADAFRIAGPGDIITHIYNGCPQGRIVDKSGRLLPEVADAAARGVLFDIGFGSYGYAWEVAEQALAQGLRPHFISSDLQQFNVMNPVVSLANIMSICLRLGLTLREVIEDVTASPARALGLSDRAGSLRTGLPADVTVFRIEAGTFDFVDCVNQTRRAEARFVPVAAFKDGRRFECDLARAQDERNWLTQVAEDHLPAAALRLSLPQRAFLSSLMSELAAVPWKNYPPREPDLRVARRLQTVFNRVREAHGLRLRDAACALYDCFFDTRFPMQIGLLLLRLDHAFALKRLGEVTGETSMAAA